MPGITDPAEEYFKDGLWGWATSAWKKLVATGAGVLHIQFAGQEADVEVTQTAPADLQVGLSGYYGAAWKKLSMVWGYSSVYREYKASAVSGAGTKDLTFAGSSAGVARVIQGICGVNTDTVCSVIAIFMVSSGTTVYIRTIVEPPVWHSINLLHELVLQPDDYCLVRFYDCADGDVIVASAWGYDMSLTS